MADSLSPADRSKNMAAIKSKDTKPEVFVRKHLFHSGYRYRICPRHIYGHPDIYMAQYSLAIFIHGCFWHRHSNCRLAYTPKSKVEFWQDKFDKNIKRDKQVLSELATKGVRVLIVWECAIRYASKNTSSADALFHLIESFIQTDMSFLEISDMDLKDGNGEREWVGL